MQQGWTLEHELKGGGFTFELRRYTLPAPVGFILEEPDPVVAMEIGRPSIGESRPCCLGSSAPFRKLGRLIFTPANTPIEVRGIGGQSLVAACKLKPELFHDAKGQLNLNERALAQCGDVQDRLLGVLLDQLIREAPAPDLGSDLILESIGTFMSVRLARLLTTAPQTSVPSLKPLSERNLRLITEELKSCNSVSLAHLAQRCGLSVRSLTRSYRAATGTTITRTLINYRIDTASTLLKQGKLSIKEIADLTGFDDYSAFSKAFKRETGSAPGEFRKLSCYRYGAPRRPSAEG